MDEEPILGIDLGTSNSAASCVIAGKPVMIDLREASDSSFGSHTLPSVVAFDEHGASFVGRPAQARLHEDPKRTFFGTKRFIGRAYDSPSVQQMLKSFPYKVVPTQQGTVGVELNGRTKSLSAIAAYILKVVQERAQAQLKQHVRKAVITVPAYYNDNQRDAVMHAGRMAGLDVLRIVSEPTAAAIAYGLARDGERNVVVYDLGGGTFDVSVMRVKKTNLDVIATAGDTFLGGEDFDAAIMSHVFSRYLGAKRVALSGNSAANARLKEAVELAKRRLSVKETTLLTCKNVVRVDRNLDDIEMPLSRADVERLVAPLVARTLEICDRALSDAKLKKEEIADVILVGGQSQMPYVRARVSEHFARQVRCELNPDEIVALGASLVPHLGTKQGLSFHDVVPMSIGLAMNGKFVPVIARNTRVPYRRAVKFKLPASTFAGSKLEVFQGDAPELYKNERLGPIPLDAVRPGPADVVAVSVMFAMTPECLLNVSVTNEDTGETQTILLRTAELLI